MPRNLTDARNLAMDLRLAALEAFDGPAGLMRELREQYDQAESVSVKLRILDIAVKLIEGAEYGESAPDGETEKEMEAVAHDLLARRAQE